MSQKRSNTRPADPWPALATMHLPTQLLCMHEVSPAKKKKKKKTKPFSSFVAAQLRSNWVRSHLPPPPPPPPSPPPFSFEEPDKKTLTLVCKTWDRGNKLIWLHFHYLPPSLFLLPEQTRSAAASLCAPLRFRPSCWRQESHRQGTRQTEEGKKGKKGEKGSVRPYR